MEASEQKQPKKLNVCILKSEFISDSIKSHQGAGGHKSRKAVCPDMRLHLIVVCRREGLGNPKDKAKKRSAPQLPILRRLRSCRTF